MNDIAKNEVFLKLVRFSFQAIGYIITCGFVAILILTWALTEPIYELGQWIERNGKLKTKKQITN
jgi:hypothetical protein